MDRLHSHFDNETVEQLLIAGIETLYLSPHSSHLMQPLDQEPFANVKRIFRRKCKLAKTSLLGDKPSSLENKLQSIVAQSEDEAFTKKVIQRGFISSGIEPANWEVIEKRLEDFIEEKFFKNVPQQIEKRTEPKSLRCIVDRYYKLLKAFKSKKKEKGSI